MPKFGNIRSIGELITIGLAMLALAVLLVVLVELWRRYRPGRGPLGSEARLAIGIGGAGRGAADGRLDRGGRPLGRGASPTRTGRLCRCRRLPVRPPVADARPAPPDPARPRPDGPSARPDDRRPAMARGASRRRSGCSSRSITADARRPARRSRRSGRRPRRSSVGSPRRRPRDPAPGDDGGAGGRRAGPAGLLGCHRCHVRAHAGGERQRHRRPGRVVPPGGALRPRGGPADRRPGRMGRRDRAVRANPGPPGRDEADWYDEWLDVGRGSGVIYVPRDYDAEPEYWQGVLKAMPKTAAAPLRAGREASRIRQALVDQVAEKGQGTRRSPTTGSR